MSTAIPPWWGALRAPSASGWGGLHLGPGQRQGGTRFRPIPRSLWSGGCAARLRQRCSGRLRQPPADLSNMQRAWSYERRRLRRHLPPQPPAGRPGKYLCENDDAFVFCGRGTGGALCSVSVSRVGLDGIHLCISGEGGLPRQCGGRRPHLLAQSPGRSLRPGGGAFEHLAEPPGFALRGQAAAFLDLGGGRPAEYCTSSRPST